MLKLKKIVLQNFMSVGNLPIEIDLCSYNKTLVIGQNGSGKEQPVSEPVLTPNGWSTMGDLRPGDYVIGSSGLPIKVLSVHPQGVQDVYTVKTMDGVDIRCGKEHLWSVWVHHHSKNILKTYTTQELINKGVRSSIGTARYTLPKFDGLQEGKSVDFGYALGYCLGNACFSRSQLNVSYDDRIESKLLPLLEPSLGIPSNSRVTDGNHSGQSNYSWSSINPEIAKYRNSGLSHDKCLHKDHSDWLLWDYQSRLELLQGLLDSDGSVCVDKHHLGQHLRFCSTSINLIVLVRDLIRSLGGRACEPIAENRTHYKSGNCWELAFRMPVCPFKLHADKWRPSRRCMQSTISDITKNDYQEEQVCITVDAEDCLYVTTGFKLTHNSSTLLDSLVFALYGTAYRNVNKNQLINSINQCGLLVELYFSISNIEYRVVRGLQPSIFDIYVNDVKLDELSSIKEQQRYLEDHILKINYITFSNIAILGSANYIPFMNQPLATRRALVEELLDINLFAQMLSVAKDSSRELVDNIKSLQHDIKSIKEQILLVEGFIVSINKPIETINYSGQIKDLLDRIDTLDAENAKISKTKEDYENELSNTPNPQSDIDKIKEFSVEYSSQIKQETKKLKFYDNNDMCPTCTQSIDAIFKRHASETCQALITNLSDRVKKAGVVLDSKTKILQTITKLQTNIKNLENNYRNNIANISNLRTQIKNLELTQIPTVSQDVHQYESQLKTLQNNLKNIYDKLSKLQKEKSDYDIVIKLLSDSGIKTKILEKYLPYFNAYINNYLSTFGFDVVFEFNSLFKEVIKSRHKDGFTYNSFSEGEKMKISLAIMLAFRDLASLKSTNSTNILIMDEIFDSSLDNDSNYNLTRIINDMVDNNVFIISHRNDINTEDFDRSMIFSKSKDFTKIEYN